MSSGSNRDERAAEPASSQKITVKWRRSASSRGAGFVAPSPGSRAPVELRDGTQHLAAVPKRNADFRQILICEITQYAGIDVVLGKALSVLGQPERCQPLCDRRHSTLSPALLIVTRSIVPIVVPSVLRTGVPSTRSLAIKLWVSRDVASICIIASITANQR